MGLVGFIFIINVVHIKLYTMKGKSLLISLALHLLYHRKDCLGFILGHTAQLLTLEALPLPTVLLGLYSCQFDLAFIHASFQYLNFAACLCLVFHQLSLSLEAFISFFLQNLTLLLQRCDFTCPSIQYFLQTCINFSDLFLLLLQSTNLTRVLLSMQLVPLL